MKSTIIFNYKFNRGFLDALLAGIPEGKLATQPVGIANHPLWQVGHLAASSAMGIKRLGGALPVDEGFIEKFGHGSKPVGDAAAYPSLTQLLQTLDRVRPLLVATFENAGDDVLNAAPAVDRVRERFATNGNFVTFLLTAHESFHLGQLSSWRRAIGLGSAL